MRKVDPSLEEVLGSLRALFKAEKEIVEEGRVIEAKVDRANAGQGGLKAQLGRMEALLADILANRRRVPPFGLKGGGPGAAGRTWLQRKDHRIEELGPTDKAAMEEGDVFVIETPGGGGYGQ